MRRVTKRMPKAIAGRRLSRGRLGTTSRAMGTAAAVRPADGPDRAAGGARAGQPPGSRAAQAPRRKAPPPSRGRPEFSVIPAGPSSQRAHAATPPPKASTPQFANPRDDREPATGARGSRDSRRHRSCSPFRGTASVAVFFTHNTCNPVVAFPSSATTRRSSALRFVSGAETPILLLSQLYAARPVLEPTGLGSV